MMALPPYAALLALSAEDDPWAPVLVMPFREQVMGRPGFLHGGAISGLLEMAAIGALQAALDPGARIKPVNVTVDFMRGVREGDTRAQGMVTRLGNRIANVHAIAWQDDRDRPIASARMNYLIARQD